jgi:hypothetical protein
MSGFPVNSKEDRMIVEDRNPFLPNAFHITVSCIFEENTPISSLTITDIPINGLCNTLRLPIFSLYIIYVLRLNNIVKYEIFFRNRKLSEIFCCISIGKQGNNASTTSMYPQPLQN